MNKVDFRRERPDLYTPGSKDFSLVEVPPFTFLMVDGHGDPNSSPDYAQALEALYALSYAVKFASKLDLGRDYVVAPLEGLWHSENLDAFVTRSKDQWSWTMMIRQPDWITDDMGDAARATIRALDHGIPGEVYNIAAEEPSTWRALQQAQARVDGFPAPIALADSVLRTIAPFASQVISDTSMRLSTTAALRDLDFTARNRTVESAFGL